MTEQKYIVANALPLAQDFKAIKNIGLGFIQENIGEQWTNLNASDPGVTILDQVCYALTELGYCNNFPIEDILTNVNGKLEVIDQFYMPEDILTTSPVTFSDYISYLVDGLPEITNAVISPAVHLVGSEIEVTQTNEYQVYLQITNTIQSASVISELCTAAFYYLNQARSVGEFFSLPLPLTPLTYYVKGTIVLDRSVANYNVKSSLAQAIAEYIFPAVTTSGYDQLIAKGTKVNSILNGPLLHNGWLSSENLPLKKNEISQIEIIEIIEGVKGFSFSTGLVISDLNGQAQETFESGISQLLTFDISGLTIKYTGQATSDDALKYNVIASVNNRETIVNLQGGAAAGNQTDIPKGKYRDISTYYSIQNTFPDAFATGINAVPVNAKAHIIAQSRQLKGYLTLFDQILANQFSQLANLDKLFSFKNSGIGATSDDRSFYEMKDYYERQHLIYPVPYRLFSPTYYYQALYDVPNIQPLLKDHNIFKFSYEPQNDRKPNHQNWEEYKSDPYNAYIHGLAAFVEDDGDNLKRRNDILNHLIARHGESPYLLDKIINGAVYTGDAQRDMIITKSLYLQNWGLLSYYRHKGYNYMGADKIQITTNMISAKTVHNFDMEQQTDFIFNSGQVDAEAKLHKHDFVNFSALELKLSLLFGLKSHYKNFIALKYGNLLYEKEYEIALWLISQRRGMIFIEMDLLLRSASFEIFIIHQDGEIIISEYTTDKLLNLREFSGLTKLITDDQSVNLSDQLSKNNLILGDTVFNLIPTKSVLNNKFYKPIPTVPGYKFTARVKFKNGISFENRLLFSVRTVFVFPDFISQFISADFADRLAMFMDDSLPIGISNMCLSGNTISMAQIIHAYANWHNALLGAGDSEISDQVGIYAAMLAELLNELKILKTGI